MPKKARSTQSLVNSYPEWSSIRKDEQSLGFQFMNTMGHLLDDLKKQDQRIGNNYYLPSSIISDIDVYYSMQLPDSFEFEKLDDDNTELLFTTPTVSGVVSGVSYSVPIANGNDVENFWYIHPPDRLSLGETISNADVLMASGYSHLSPLSLLTTSGLLHNDNVLTVTVSGGTTFFDVTDDNFTRRALVEIQGVTRAGLSVVEQIPFIHDDTVQTIHEYAYLSQPVKVYNTETANETFVTVESAQFAKTEYPVTYQNIDRTLGDANRETFWGLGMSSTGLHCFNYRAYQAEDVDIRLDGWTAKDTLFQIELLDEDGNNYQPMDMSVEPNSNRLWVVSSSELFVYNDELPYLDGSLLSEKQYDAPSVIQPSSYYAVLNDQVTLDYVWLRPVQGITRSRVYVQKPDGSRFLFEGGSESTYVTGSTSWTEHLPIVTRTIRASDIVTLDQRGDWIYTFDVQYADGTTSRDKKVITVASKSPLAQFDLTELGLTNMINGIDFDSEEKLWVRDIGDGVYEIYRHHDIMIIDFAKKILYFRENYDQVRIYD